MRALITSFIFLSALTVLNAHDNHASNYRHGYESGYAHGFNRGYRNDDHWHYWNHDHVYVGDPWYHPRHVVVVNGGLYPNYYAGYPYYFYAPQYYYYPSEPGINLNVQLGG